MTSIIEIPQLHGLAEIGTVHFWSSNEDGWDDTKVWRDASGQHYYADHLVLEGVECEEGYFGRFKSIEDLTSATQEEVLCHLAARDREAVAGCHYDRYGSATDLDRVRRDVANYGFYGDIDIYVGMTARQKFAALTTPGCFSAAEEFRRISTEKLDRIDEIFGAITAKSSPEEILSAVAQYHDLIRPIENEYPERMEPVTLHLIEVEDVAYTIQDVIGVSVLNLTPHPIVFVGDDGRVSATYEPSGPAARVTIESVPAPVEVLEYAGKFYGLPVQIMESATTADVTGLPDQQDGVLIIVSQMVADALPDRTDLHWPTDVVRDQDGRPIGCRKLARRDRWPL